MGFETLRQRYMGARKRISSKRTVKLPHCFVPYLSLSRGIACNLKCLRPPNQLPRPFHRRGAPKIHWTTVSQRATILVT
jgi:hypothetical protein